MQTKRWNINNDHVSMDQAIQEASALLASGELVAFPTETVYGLGADATNETAVAKIFRAKNRPQDNPLIAHVAGKTQLKQLVSEMPAYAEKLLTAFAPGPLTVILPANGTCAANVTAGLDTVAVRIPDHPAALRLLAKCDFPVAAPSANLSGKPSPTTADHVWTDLNGRIAGLLDAGPTGVGVESTVIDCTGEIPVILRPGGITKADVARIAGDCKIDPALSNADAQTRPKSPGMKYKHYAPEIPLWLVEGPAEKIQQAIDREKNNGKQVGVLASTGTSEKLRADRVIPLGLNDREIAAHLYDGLRAFKEGHEDLIICEAFSEEGIGQAIMNRLKKAAAGYLREI
jgi:L-threonylcarbamoyladenylate synthase